MAIVASFFLKGICLFFGTLSQLCDMLNEELDGLNGDWWGTLLQTCRTFLGIEIHEEGEGISH